MDSEISRAPNGGKNTGETSFRAALKSYRVSLGLSLADLAKRSGKSTAYLGAIETGKTQIPDTNVVLAIGKALNLNRGQLGDFVILADLDKGMLGLKKQGYSPHTSTLARFSRAWDDLSLEDQAEIAAILEKKLVERGLYTEYG